MPRAAIWTLREISWSRAGSSTAAAIAVVKPSTSCMVDVIVRTHSTAAFGRLLDRGDLLADLFGRLRGLRRERFDLRGHDREAAAGLAGARRLDRGVERKQIGLRGDRLDQPDHVADPLRGAGERFDLAIRALHVRRRDAPRWWPSRPARPISLIEEDSSSAAPATFCTLAEPCSEAAAAPVAWRRGRGRDAGERLRGAVHPAPRCRRPPPASRDTELRNRPISASIAALALFALRLLGAGGLLQPCRARSRCRGTPRRRAPCRRSRPCGRRR